MDSTVLVALISFAGIIASGIISAIVSMSLVNWRLKEIEKRLDNHNGYAEKFASASQDIALIQQDISWIKQSIAELKER